MVDLSVEMAELHQRLGLTTSGVARPAHVLQFLSAECGEGASTVAREFARSVAHGARRGVWLVELDVLRGHQFDAISQDPDLYGALGEPMRASPDGSVFFSISPRLKGLDGRPWADERYLDAHPVGRARFWVTRFRRESLHRGQAVSILTAPDYWSALRRCADYVIIDAPSAERSDVALATAAIVDANILVVAGDRRDTRAPLGVRDALVQAGGYCAGIVFNRAPVQPPRFLRSLLP